MKFTPCTDGGLQLRQVREGGLWHLVDALGCVRLSSSYRLSPAEIAEAVEGIVLAHEMLCRCAQHGILLQEALPQWSNSSAPCRPWPQLPNVRK